jgi:hypothetical protein
MLEANPDLTPTVVKNILISAAVRLGGRPAIRQGFGVVNAAACIEMALKENHDLDGDNYHAPRVVAGQIVFRYHDDAAEAVTLAGDFNDWDPGASLFERCGDGLWKASMPCCPAGKYRYKFLIDGTRWIEDPSHGMKEEDAFGGFNSVLIVG